MLKVQRRPKNIHYRLRCSPCKLFINLGSADKATAEKSIHALIDELERCELLGIPFLVLHPGSLGTLSKEDGSRQISKNLAVALEQANSTTMILLETMAGQGSSFGSSFQELASLYTQSTHKNRIGFCFDTCHVFAAGYDMSTEDLLRTSMATV